MHLVLVPPVVAPRDPYTHHSAPTALVVGAPPAVVAKGHMTHTRGEKGHEESHGHRELCMSRFEGWSGLGRRQERGRSILACLNTQIST